MNLLFLISMLVGHSTCERHLKATQSTLQYYDLHAEEYNRRHQGVSYSIVNLRRTFLSFIPSNGIVVDLGCGHGRDAVYFNSRGRIVIAIEPSPILAAIASEALKMSVLRTTAQEFNLLFQRGRIDGVWAMASLIHVPSRELEDVFRRIFDHLAPGGVFYSSFVMGVGVPDQEEVEPQGRYFSRASVATIEKALKNVGFEIDTRLSGPNRDDYHKAHEKPSEGFHFHNFFAFKPKNS